MPSIIEEHLNYCLCHNHSFLRQSNRIFKAAEALKSTFCTTISHYLPRDIYNNSYYTTMTAPKTEHTTRAYSKHQPNWQRFQSDLVIPSSNVGGDKNAAPNVYQRQYSHVYHQRLAALGPRCWETMLPSDVVQVKRILELKEGEPSLVVGTLVRETTNTKEPTLHPDSECRKSDALYLEDESGRVVLEVPDMHSYCTGLVVGLRGTVQMDGVMLVEEVYAPAMSPPTRMETTPLDTQAVPHLLLVSGLLCGGSNVSSLPRDMLLSFLQGRFGVEKAALISQVVVAGGLVQADDKVSQADALRDLDGFLLQVSAAGIPVDVVPGQNDPTTANWPQRPLHSALLPRSSASSNLVRRTPNPYAAVHNDHVVMGADGRNVADLTRRFLKKEDNDDAWVPLYELEALQSSLKWSHICPTGPDSIPTVPHAESDPMCMTQAPSVYFCGNAHAFDTAISNGTRLVCVPEFATTGQAILVNLENLNVEILSFDAQI
jgi:DNA polymerase delta subunit 2